VKNNSKTARLVRLALLTAILIVMEVTGLGFIKTPTGIEFTLMQVPVIIGAILMGPMAGAILGGVFGLLSFSEAFGKSFFGVTLMGISPVYTFILLVVTRVLMGLGCGLVFKAFKNKKGIIPFAVTGLSGALLNTVLFMSTLLLLFGSSDYIMGMRGAMDIFTFVAAFVGVQGLIEAGVCAVVSAAICRVLWRK